MLRTLAIENYRSLRELVLPLTSLLLVAAIHVDVLHLRVAQVHAERAEAVPAPMGQMPSRRGLPGRLVFAAE